MAATPLKDIPFSTSVLSTDSLGNFTANSGTFTGSISANNLKVYSAGNEILHASSDGIKLDTSENINLTAGQDINLTASEDINLKSSSAIILSGNSAYIDAGEIKIGTEYEQPSYITIGKGNLSASGGSLNVYTRTNFLDNVNIHTVGNRQVIQISADNGGGNATIIKGGSAGIDIFTEYYIKIYDSTGTSCVNLSYNALTAHGFDAYAEARQFPIPIH